MAKKDFDYIWTGKKRTIFGLPLSFTRYFLTETKFITRKGFLSLEEDELDLYTVTDKKLVLKFWQRIFKCGTIIMYVIDTDTPQKHIESIKAPREVLALLDKHINIQRDRYRTRGRDLIAGGHDHCGFDHDPRYNDDTFDDSESGMI
ncbi:MAG: PH domain-containing protein [Porcipelethomonas sp.]